MAKRNYALSAGAPPREFAAPKLPYQPPQPKHYRPKIGLIGCGGISATNIFPTSDGSFIRSATLRSCLRPAN